MADIINFRDEARCTIGAPSYRAYSMGRAGVRSTRIVDAKTDAQAKARTFALLTSQAIELWDRGRFVARFLPQDQPVIASISLIADPPIQL